VQHSTSTALVQPLRVVAVCMRACDPVHYVLCCNGCTHPINEQKIKRLLLAIITCSHPLHACCRTRVYILVGAYAAGTYVQNYRASGTTVPVMVALHGSGGDGKGMAYTFMVRLHAMGLQR
jgi:hypothetical protein